MQIQPLNEQVLVKPLEESEKTPGGIIRPKTAAQENTVLAKVLAVSNGILMDDGQVRRHEVKEGDVVIFSRANGLPIEFKGEEFMLVNSLRLLSRVAEV